jgi:hypothetical protein
VDRVAERVRRVHRPWTGWSIAALGAALRQDVTYARRGFMRSPGFIAVAVLTLSVGVGATTALYSALDTLVLQRLPVPAADELVVLGWSSPTAEAK